MMSSPLRLGQLEPVERPRDPRGGGAARRALERHRRTRLQRLVDEAVAQHRRGVCNWFQTFKVVKFTKREILQIHSNSSSLNADERISLSKLGDT